MTQEYSTAEMPDELVMNLTQSSRLSQLTFSGIIVGRSPTKQQTKSRCWRIPSHKWNDWTPSAGLERRHPRNLVGALRCDNIWLRARWHLLWSRARGLLLWSRASRRLLLYRARRHQLIATRVIRVWMYVFYAKKESSSILVHSWIILTEALVWPFPFSLLRSRRESPSLSFSLERN